MARTARKALSVLLSICLACLLTPYSAFGAEEQGDDALESSDAQMKSTQGAEEQGDDIQLSSAQGAEDQGANSPEATLQTAGAQEGVTYQVATLKDADHPEEGLDWKDKTCTDYTVMTSSMQTLANQTVVVSGKVKMGAITISGTVNLILEDDCALDVSYSGICVSDGATLNIYGQKANSGALTATSKIAAAAIGGGFNKSGGAINIYGGIINAYTEDSSSPAAGIGSGYGATGGSIRIYGGIVTAESEEGAGIGGGRTGACDGIYIYDGEVHAQGGDNCAGIGAGFQQSARNIYIYDGTVDATGGAFAPGIGGISAGDANGIFILGGTVIATGGLDSSGIRLSGDDKRYNITISGGTVTAYGQSGSAGISCPATSAADSGVTITGGTVFAYGGSDAAGIGGGKSASNGPITISGGEVTSYGGANGAGIGGGKGGSASKVTVSGGTVKAYGGSKGAGIGGGHKGTGSYITISGGDVTATGGVEAAGIGGSYQGGGAEITVSGGTLTAQGGQHAAGIGGGWKGQASNITISGGSVNATGGEGGAGIGGGEEGNASGIKISGGTVTAVGGAEQGTCIGGGDEGTASGIQITGGYVKALRSNNGSAAIGGGRNRGCGDIVIRDCVIEAQGGYWAPAIGTGCSCPKDSKNSVTISNAVVKCYRGGGDGYPTIGLGPWANSGATCTVTIGEGCELWNASEGTLLASGEADVTGKIGAFDAYVDNGTVTARGITTKFVGFNHEVSEADQALMESLVSRISIAPSMGLSLLGSQASIAQAALGLSDAEMIAIVADPDKHIELSLRFEVGVVKVNTGMTYTRSMEYFLRPVAAAVLYDGEAELQSAERVLTADDLQAAKGTLTVTLPVPEGFDPAQVTHTSDDGETVYEEFTEDGDDRFTYDEAAGTISFTITHCSHLVSSFSAPIPATGDATPVAAVAIMALLAGALTIIARRRTMR